MPADAQGPPPWARTETRADCLDYDQLRKPHYGDTHVHTALSFDAVTGGVVEGPRGAYAFAKGLPTGLPPYDAMMNPARTAQLRRPLDFTAISDHGELMGETSICLTPSHPEYSDPVCQEYRDNIPQLDGGTGAFAFFIAQYAAVPVPFRHDFCGVDGTICTDQASLVWADTQDAAEEHYDRSDACVFTTFNAYEYTRAPLASNLHRNVIFRNEKVPSLPITGVEQPQFQGLWPELQSQCIDGIAGCDVLAIPHNSNLSGGAMFVPENIDGSPHTGADAAFRARMEPLVEITQHKGDSECRPGVLSSDELCGFEKMTGVLLGVSPGSGTTYDPRLFVRNALKEGLELEEAIGANPFKMGIIASTDTHNAVPGMVNEADYGKSGHLGTRDGTPALVVASVTESPLGGMEAQGGGLAVVWAEENSRDAIFSAMRRREVYGTSGTRPTVRFFGGDYDADLCGSPDLVDTGYRRGVPMGGDLGALRKKKSPVFTVLALKDPGGASVASAPLQRVQIIKGWVNSTGSTQERVIDVAGDPDNGASVDTTTCTPSGAGFDSLCAVWEDPDFLPSQRAFYYVRVVENPMCRWSQYVCNDAGIDCALPGTIPAGMEECCNEDRPHTIQERAWTSPIFYSPESFGRFKSVIKVKGGGADTLKIKASFERAAEELAPDTEDITLSLVDDDVIYTATIPAGTMTVNKPGASWSLTDPVGAVDGIKKATLKINAKGNAKLSLSTVKTDLSKADLTDHFIHTTLEAGSYSTEHARLWEVKGTTLKPQN
ncbi:MAG: DUF3604 domain-containing protein [Myxococcales bacterium]|nr:MAG: DUF3604 domain-containing protein [Myxococcales bacterium]